MQPEHIVFTACSVRCALCTLDKQKHSRTQMCIVVYVHCADANQFSQNHNLHKASWKSGCGQWWSSKWMNGGVVTLIDSFVCLPRHHIKCDVRALNTTKHIAHSEQPKPENTITQMA